MELLKKKKAVVVPAVVEPEVKIEESVEIKEVPEESVAKKPLPKKK